jgi:predicted lipid-binding transport protein (Tim44 family)
MIRNRWLIMLGAIATAFVLVSADAEARVGGGFSGGSRGSRTFSAPPATPTAPSAAPIQRSITQPGNAAPIGQTGMRPGLFGGGLFGGLAAGFLGAGLFGLLFGHGLFGGMAGFASIIGLLLQVVLVVIVARLVFAWWQRRNMPTPAYAAAHPVTGDSFRGLSGMLGGANVPPTGDPLAIAKLTIDKSDYDAFERALGEIQAAYSMEDLAALRAQVTPEMLSYFSEQFAENASRGLINRVTDVKLLRGDLAEAWREGNIDYATVAMNFALKDSMVERTSGRTVGDGERSEVTELWTFMRARGGNWLLSAIQQSQLTGVPNPRKPIRQIFACCCARPVSGHAVANPTIALTKSRRRIAFSKALDWADYRSQRILQQGFVIDEIGFSGQFAAPIPSRSCPLWVKSGHWGVHDVRFTPKSGHCGTTV